MDSPKQKFLKKKDWVNAHNDWVLTPVFEAAADAAMLQMFVELRDYSDPTQAAAAHQRMCGARQFLETFRSIGEVPKPVPRRPIGDNLSHV